MMKALTRFSFSLETVKNFVELNFIHDLCERIWSSPQWIKFSYNCLRFMENISHNEEFLPVLKSSSFSIKILAAINNSNNQAELFKID